MNLIVFLVTLISIQFAGHQSSNIQTKNEWQGLIPLQSNRQDVEKLLGASSGDNVYKTNHGRVSVSYASDRCKGELPGWNVPTDTVLSFSIEPKVSPSFDSLNLDETKLVKIYGHAGYEYYTDSYNGIQYTVYYDGRVVTNIKYIPKEADNVLRCKGFPPYNPVTETYIPSQQFRRRDWKFGASVVESAAIALQNYPDNKMYVFVYADEQMSDKEYSTYVERIKTHLSRKGLSSEIITINKGGYRNVFEVEIFLLPKTFPEPTATPTLVRKSKKTKS